MMRRPTGVLGPVSDACMTVSTWPPMSTVADRELGVVFCPMV
jgi:hypothetical protein